ncbi:MAG: rod shape-determining protein MreC [Actinomycetota bacterium]|nr:rod shape-determining protein MreC [Actinomycetota bacterium]
MTAPTRRDNGSSRRALVLLVLAAIAVMAVDASGDDSPVDVARSAVGEVIGPVQTGFAAVSGPLGAAAERFADADELHTDLEVLEAENAKLRTELQTFGLVRARGEARDVMSLRAQESGFELVGAEVVAFGPAQSFSRTVTIDAGTADGVQADMTVLSADGLVGRVVRADRSTATVLLVVDSASVVGGRLDRDLELGMARGDGDLSGDARLHLTTMDPTTTPQVGDSVLSWGSDGGTPYVAGVPIGQVESVESSPQDQTTTAIVAPYVDFSALDLVSVVVGAAPSSGSEQATGAGGRR